MNQQILVIDDSAQIHPLIKAILADEPVDVQSATDPKIGLTLAASICPDLILLDVDMPEMDGFETCKHLKADPATARCPIIFLTSHTEVKEKVRGFGLGAADYVTKPFNRAELIARVRASLRTNHVIRDLEAKATVDELTGLGNRAMFIQRLEAEICLRVRFDNPLSVIAMDVDQFTKINETYGFPVGNQVIQAVGKLLAGLCRAEDVVCRFGSDEFVIIAPHTTGPAAVVFAERICEMLSQTRITPEGTSLSVAARESFRVTASFGVSAALVPYDRLMLQRADDALYQSKQGGRNQVTMGSQIAEPQAAAA